MAAIRGLEPIPAALEVGRALDKSPADHRANVQRQTTDSHLNLDIDIRPLLNMSGLWEEAAAPERTHAEHHTPLVPQLTASMCGLFIYLFSKFTIQHLH